MTGHATLRDFPSYRLRHRVRLWRYRRGREARYRRQVRAGRRPAVRLTSRRGLAAVLLIGIVTSCCWRRSRCGLTLRVRTPRARKMDRHSSKGSRRDRQRVGSSCLELRGGPVSEFEAAKARMDNVSRRSRHRDALIGRTPDAIAPLPRPASW